MERRNERKPLLLVTDRVEELFQASDTVMAPTSKLEKVSWTLYIFVLAALVGFALNVHKYVQGYNVSEAFYLAYFGIAATVYSSAILSSIPMLCTIRRQPSTTGTTATHHFKGLNLIFSVLFIISGVHKVLLFISYDPPFASAKHFGDAVTVIHYISEAYLFIWLLSTTYRPYSTEEYDNVKSYYKAYLCVILSVNLMAFSRLIFVDYNKEKVDPNSLLYSVGTFDIAYRFLELSYIAKLFFYLWRPLEDIAVPNEKIEKRTEDPEMRLQRHVFYGGLGLSLAWATAMCILVIVLWMDCSEDPETCSNTAYLVVYIIGHAVAVVLSIFQIISVRAANAWDYVSFAPHIQLLFAGAMTAFVYIVLFIFDIGRRFSISQIDLTLGAEIAAMTSTTCQAIFILYYYKTKGTINGRTLAVRIQWMFSVAFFIGYHIGIILINFISSKTVEFTFVGGFEAVIFAVAEVMHIIAAFMCIDIADPTFLGA